MIIQRTSKTTISPRTREELLTRKTDKFHNAVRELRHPLGIYNLSLMNIWETFEEVLDELDSVLEKQAFRNNPPDGTWDKKLMRRQEDLIARMMRHFDDCLSLICCFYPLTPNKSREEDRELVMKKPEVKQAMKKVKTYCDHIANMMNHMKHYQGVLRGIVLFNDDISILGYYVERINQTGIIEPHPDIHPQFKGRHTAFSFNRDLRYKFWIVYAVSEIVADAIQQIYPKSDTVQEDSNLEKQVFRIAKRLEQLPNYQFNDEVYKDVPRISVEENEETTHLILEYPSQTTILPSPFGNLQIALAWVEDGITNQMQMLYYPPGSPVTTYRQKADT